MVLCSPSASLDDCLPQRAYKAQQKEPHPRNDAHPPSPVLWAGSPPYPPRRRRRAFLSSRGRRWAGAAWDLPRALRVWGPPDLFLPWGHLPQRRHGFPAAHERKKVPPPMAGGTYHSLCREQSSSGNYLPSATSLMDLDSLTTHSSQSTSRMISGGTIRMMLEPMAVTSRWFLMQ